MEIRDNLLDRIAEAEREGWLGEIEGLRVSLAGAASKIDQIDAVSGGTPIHSACLAGPQLNPPDRREQRTAETMTG